MKKIFHTIIIFFQVLGYIEIKGECQCYQLISELECQQISQLCSWNNFKQQCIVKSVYQEYYGKPYFCQANSQLECLSSEKQNSCQWLFRCTHFTGCESFRYQSNEECQGISKLCYSNGIYCIERTNCDQFTNQNSCKIDKLGKYCFWNKESQKCQNVQTCEQLPLELNTDELCRAQIFFCTTKIGGGCEESGLMCKDQNNEIQCKYDKYGKQQCIWDQMQCKEKICENAPQTIQTDEECISFISNCALKENGGCVKRDTCDAFKFQLACTFDKKGQKCFWDGTNCMEKNCENAPMFVSNSQCSIFDSNCIAKLGGGCQANTVCDKIEVEEACIKDILGKDCIFEQVCREKICSDAPVSIKTYDECQNYVSATFCVVQTDGGCYSAINCEDIVNEISCIKDSQKNACIWLPDIGCKTKTCSLFIVENQCSIASQPELQCIWKDRCFYKECVFAPKTYNTHSLCQSYNPSCTLHYNGGGCAQIPLVCEAHVTEISCVVKGYNSNITNQFQTQPCGWQQEKGECLDKSCQTAPLNLTTNKECQNYLPHCIIRNPINGISKGCMENQECKNKLIEESCRTFTDGQECFWNSNTLSCEEKQCSTANLEYTTFSFSLCLNYRKKVQCIQDNLGQNCMDKKETCQELGKTNCEPFSTTKQILCYWDGQYCVDLECKNIIYRDPEQCKYQIYDLKCTANNELNGCQDLRENCSDYGILENCWINKKEQQCKWNMDISKCQDAKCSDAPNSLDFSYHNDCINFLTVSSICEVIPKVNNQGCSPKKLQCNDYKSQSECHSTQSNYNDLDGFDNCIWKNELCQEIDTPPNYLARKNVVYSSSWCVILFGFMFTIDNGSGIRQCQAKKMSCDQYTTEIECSFSFKPCYYIDGACKVMDSSIDCSYVQGNNYICSSYSKKCKGDLNRTDLKCITKDCTDYLKDDWISCQKYSDCAPQNSLETCTIRMISCDLYTTINQCFQIDVDKFCQWENQSQTCKDWDQKCESIKIVTDKNICSKYSENCIYTQDEKSCQQILDTCQDYKNEINCSSSNTENYCVWRTSQGCFQASQPSDCYFIKGINLTDSYCQQFNSKCQATRSKTSCYPIGNSCYEYTNPEECNSNNLDDCTLQSFGSDICTVVGFDLSCDQIYLGQSKYDCEYFDCAQKDLYYCEEKTCQNAKPVYYWDCEVWSKKEICVYNSVSNSCISKQQNCSDYKIESDCNEAEEGYCFFYNTRCQLKQNCYQAENFLYYSHDSCFEFMEKCTVAPLGGCQDVTPCNQRNTEKFCLQNLKNCHWNQIEYKCVEKNCSEYEQNESFDTPEECQRMDCELRANGYGCQSRQQCLNYNKLQCTENSKNQLGVFCAWNYKIDQCEIKICSTAPQSLSTHDQCNKFMSTCTVNSTYSIDSQLINSGCANLSKCSNYISEEQCKINQLFKKCGWNGEKCDDFSCLTAPSNEVYSSHQSCSYYLEGCTLNPTGSGCIQIPNTCEEILLQESCLTNNKGDQCFWQEGINKCVIKTCDIAPQDLSTQSECQQFMDDCTINENQFCFDVQCEDYRFTTESECNNVMNGCTTDGFKCVEKHLLCEGALAEAGCTTNLKGQLCHWANHLDPPHCIIRTCYTAYPEYKTESECQDYLKGCTPQLYGGCQEKNQCSTIILEDACTITNLGDKCQWDNYYCRDFDCQDLYGYTHQNCNQQWNQCTVGLDGQCARMQNCEFTYLQEACIYGLNGPCLWITNGDYSACYQYNSCQSIQWKTDDQCKQISPLCTTNGQSCINIKSCSDNHILGCKRGNDGECALVDNKCQIFVSCQEIKYVTHDECYMDNNKCTTNGITNCIELQNCQEYIQKESCVIDKQGILITDYKIQSTGKCQWDEINNKCRNQICDDFQYITHQECETILENCTSNGKNCILQQNCQNYLEQSICQNTLGKDGKCIWDNNICRVLKCSDITGQTTLECQQQLYDCYSDGQQCIEQSNCQDYKTQLSCQIKGLDGICYWNHSQCKLMTQCSDAGNDKFACEFNSQKCYWDNQTCKLHTCQTYYLTNYICEAFFNWDSTQIQLCKLNSQVQCIVVTIEQLSKEECFPMTLKKYHWNDNKCEICNPSFGDIQHVEVENLIETEINSVSVSFSQLVILNVILKYLHL